MMRMRQQRSFRSLWCVLAALIITVGACGDDGDDAAVPATDPAVTTTDATEDAIDPSEVAAFCAEAPNPTEEVPEGYVGSAEHVEDMRALRAVAPLDLGEDLDVIIGHFEGAVDPADPDSQIAENYPAEVNEAIDRVASFIVRHCMS